MTMPSSSPPPPSSYVPADARIAVASLEFLRTPEGTALRSAVTALLSNNTAPTVADISRLRKGFPAGVVHAALAIGQSQKNAAAKFPAIPYLWCVPEALEQATGAIVAAHKAARFAAANVTHIADLCAGIGGDTMALAAVAPVTAVDLSPVRTTCLRWNLEAVTLPLHPIAILTDRIEQVFRTLPPATAFHIDPARRSGPEGNTRRSPRFEDLIPGPDILHRLLAHLPNGAIKLSSAVDFDSLPPGHLELISHRGTVVQAVLWTGSLAATFAPNTRTATLLEEDSPAFSVTATPAFASLAAAPQEYLYEVDGAFTRAGIAAPFAAGLGLFPLTSDAGYLTGPVIEPHPALTGFRILRTLPFSPERVTEALRECGGTPGPVEVKTRGGLPGIDTDQLQRLWNKSAHVQHSVLLYRHQEDFLAIIADRLPV